jgi:hypothetical protein
VVEVKERGGKRSRVIITECRGRAPLSFERPPLAAISVPEMALRAVVQLHTTGVLRPVSVISFEQGLMCAINSDRTETPKRPYGWPYLACTRRGNWILEFKGQ